MHSWSEFADFLLGKFVIGLLGGEDGAPIAAADWDILLSYEHEIRKYMVSRMQRGVRLTMALKEAWCDTLVKDRYFVTELQKRSIKRARPHTDFVVKPIKVPKLTKQQQKALKGAGKGKAK